MLLIRRATLDDNEQIAVNHVRTWQAAYAHVLPADYLEPPRSRASGRSDAGASWPNRVAPAEVFVAETARQAGRPRRGGRTSATRTTYVQDGIGEVMAMYVVPEQWSTGAGLALMRAGVDHLVAQRPH